VGRLFEGRVAGDPGELQCHHFRGEDEVDAAGGDGAARHGIVFGRGVLGESDAAFGLDGFEAEGAVRGSAGEDDTNGALALVLGEGFKEMVYGAMSAAFHLAFLKFEPGLGHNHAGVGRDNIDVVGLDGEVVGDLGNVHGGGAGQELGQGAGMVGVEMLDEDEGHAGVWGQVFEQKREGLQASGRGTDSDNRERFVFRADIHRATARRCARLSP